MTTLFRGPQRPPPLRTRWRGFSRPWSLRHFPEITRNSVVLQGLLSGHTHGGQVRLPGFNSLYRTTRFWTGWYRLHHTQIYVNRGLGQVVAPFRLGCPPEIALFELRAR